MSLDTVQIREAHRALRAEVERLADAARHLPHATPGERTALRDELVAWLHGEVEPHMRVDELVLYPEVAGRLHDPLATAAMAYDHVAIRDRIERLAAADRPEELQQLLYGLHALIAVHLWKENELYLAMLESRTWPAPA